MKAHGGWPFALGFVSRSFNAATALRLFVYIFMVLRDRRARCEPDSYRVVANRSV